MLTFSIGNVLDMFFLITIIFFTLGGTLNTSNYCLLMKDGLSGSVHFVQPFPDEDPIPFKSHEHSMFSSIIKGSLVGETSVLRTFRMSGKELVKERVSQRKS